MMNDQALGPGMNGLAVSDLQSNLNARLNPSPNLRVSGYFDAATTEAVRIFQEAIWLRVDGIAGPATLDALHGRETGAQIRHHVPYFSRPGPHLGWAAAVAMLRQSSPAAVRQMTPTRFLTAQGDLNSDIPGHERAEMHRAFASQHALRYRPPRNWSVSAVLQLLRHGPLIIEFPRRASVQPHCSGSQLLVVTGARGAHRPDGHTTTLRVFDPDHDHTAGVYSCTHAMLVERIPPGGYAMLWV